MKNLSSIVLIVFTILNLAVFGQVSEVGNSSFKVKYYKYLGVNKTVSKRKAKFKRVTSALDNGITKIEYIQISNDQLRKEQFLKNGNPVGTWKEYSSAGELLNERDLDAIVYCEKEEDEEKTEMDSLTDDRIKDPVFVGGVKKMYSFLSTNMEYPAYDRDNGKTARIFVEFVIEKNGAVTEVCVQDQDNVSIKLLEYETIRVVTSMPNWVPGEMDDVPVRVRFKLPISFKLD